MRPYIFQDVWINLLSNMQHCLESMHRFAEFALKFVLSAERLEKAKSVKNNHGVTADRENDAAFTTCAIIV